MCGIAGIVDLAGNRIIANGIIQRMTHAIIHRGRCSAWGFKYSCHAIDGIESDWSPTLSLWAPRAGDSGGHLEEPVNTFTIRQHGVHTFLFALLDDCSRLVPYG